MGSPSIFKCKFMFFFMMSVLNIISTLLRTFHLLTRSYFKTIKNLVCVEFSAKDRHLISGRPPSCVRSQVWTTSASGALRNSTKLPSVRMILSTKLGSSFLFLVLLEFLIFSGVSQTIKIDLTKGIKRPAAGAG